MNAVAYFRVSTRRQGDSGLGIDAQRFAVASWCAANRLNLIDDFVEIESGRKNSRPVLAAAIDRAKATRSVLVIARLDRLSRSVAFIATLLESDLPFVACDVPSANRLVLHVLAAVAEEEARATSIRTKAAMAAAKARGVVFGNPGNLGAGAGHRGGRASAITRRRQRDERVALVRQRIHELRVDGAGYNQIAAVLNDEHLATSRGTKWRGMTVWRALQRMRMDQRGVTY